ncbi:hypothetical protein NAC44_01420 [Allorhizobium sp. BGMRC 0089]|uniref:hypothetical protein n=1 Tax=Allorhizobium sonneratiae TaxID=2934936 RepID=UPI0020332516|nr:hypothetical protein [Allorhizobium sonneratiae]MCM2290986.1 hypothetical protein [Allorhizobium sonneratiae]
MSQFDAEDQQEEKPLDPVLEKVRRKMVRLQLVSAGVMFVSLMAVLGAVVYKVRHVSAPEKPEIATPFAVPSDQPLALTAQLPDGFTVTSTSLSGAEILFYGKTADGQAQALVYDLKTGRMVAVVTLR